jgi:hypothetical protein
MESFIETHSHTYSLIIISCDLVNCYGLVNGYGLSWNFCECDGKYEAMKKVWEKYESFGAVEGKGF